MAKNFSVAKWQPMSIKQAEFWHELDLEFFASITKKIYVKPVEPSDAGSLSELDKEPACSIIQPVSC